MWLENQPWVLVALIVVVAGPAGFIGASFRLWLTQRRRSRTVGLLERIRSLVQQSG